MTTPVLAASWLTAPFKLQADIIDIEASAAMQAVTGCERRVSSISCRLRRLGFALWACPVRMLARTENLNYAPINVGTAHISHGTVHIRRRTPPIFLPFLSALIDQQRDMNTEKKEQPGGRGVGEPPEKLPCPEHLFRSHALFRVILLLMPRFSGAR